MASKKQKLKEDAVPTPTSREEAERLLAEIGREQREVSLIEQAMNEELEQVKAKHHEQAKPYNDSIEGKFAALHRWAEANRDSLLAKGGKTARLATGLLTWRLTPPKVNVRGTDKVLAALDRFGLTRFVRTKREIDKDAILREPEAVEGVEGLSISQKEEFAAVPDESEIERAEPSSKASAA